MTSAAVALHAVSAGYGRDPDVIRDFTLTAHAGEVVTLIGPNGAGKSTALRAAVGLHAVIRAGSVRVNGEDLHAPTPHRALRKGMVIVPQGRCNFPRLTVKESLEVATYALRDRSRVEAIDALRSRFSFIDEWHDVRVGQLSGGQQQAVEIALSTMSGPSVLLVDEPSLGLSPGMQRWVLRLIRELAEAGTAVVMVEQNVTAAVQISDRFVVMDQGRIVMEGSANDVYHDPKIRSVYLGGRVE